MLTDPAGKTRVSRGRRARPRHDRVACEHILQLFDTDASLVRSVADFLAAGHARRQGLMIVATAEHWEGIQSILTHAKGLDARALVDSAQLTVIDADDLLSRFMRRGEVNRTLFMQVAVPVMERLSARYPGGLYIYGEMVEVLAREGNYAAAARLEGFWNQLRRRYAFTILCGYSAAHFAAPDAGSALTTICEEHSRVLSHDVLGHFLLDAERDQPPGSTAS